MTAAATITPAFPSPSVPAGGGRSVVAAGHVFAAVLADSTTGEAATPSIATGSLPLSPRISPGVARNALVALLPVADRHNAAASGNPPPAMRPPAVVADSALPAMAIDGPEVATHKTTAAGSDPSTVEPEPTPTVPTPARPPLQRAALLAGVASAMPVASLPTISRETDDLAPAAKARPGDAPAADEHEDTPIACTQGIFQALPVVDPAALLVMPAASVVPQGDAPSPDSAVITTSAAMTPAPVITGMAGMSRQPQPATPARFAGGVATTISDASLTTPMTIAGPVPRMVSSAAPPSIAPIAVTAATATSDAGITAAPPRAPLASTAVDAARQIVPTTTAFTSPDAAMPAAPAVGITAPAAQVFAAAIEATDRLDRRAADHAPTDAAGVMIATAAATPIAATSGAGADQPSLDMGRHDWPAAMIDHIEKLRDAADASSTRIRIVPDALGSIDVSVRRHDDGAVQVSLTADRPATQAMLADASPDLVRLAGERGTRLDVGTGTSFGGGGDPTFSRQSTPQPQVVPRRAPSLPIDDPADAADGRVA